jgi:hypothetical protein
MNLKDKIDFPVTISSDTELFNNNISYKNMPVIEELKLPSNFNVNIFQNLHISRNAIRHILWSGCRQHDYQTFPGILLRHKEGVGHINLGLKYYTLKGQNLKYMKFKNSVIDKI